VSVDYHYLESCFNNLKVVIIGDVILDHYLIGKVERISPEAPVPVVLHESEDYRLGGAANVALNIKAMGATPYLISVIGDDAYGKQFIELVQDKGIDANHLIKDNKRRTTCKTRILARNQHLLRYDLETSDWIEESVEVQLLSQLEQLILEEKIDVIVFQDYNKGVLTKTVINKVLGLAKLNGIMTVADPKKANFLAYKGIDLFKPNLREINEGLDISISDRTPDLDELRNAAKEIQHNLGNKYALITLGAKGMFFFSAENSGLVPTVERQIADVCGAGDTVISIVALGVAAELDIEEVVVLANIAGGQVCEQVGVVSITKENLLREYSKL